MNLGYKVYNKLSACISLIEGGKTLTVDGWIAKVADVDEWNYQIIAYRYKVFDGRPNERQTRWASAIIVSDVCTALIRGNLYRPRREEDNVAMRADTLYGPLCGCMFSLFIVWCISDSNFVKIGEWWQPIQYSTLQCNNLAVDGDLKIALRVTLALDNLLLFVSDLISCSYWNITEYGLLQSPIISWNSFITWW